MAGRGGGPDGMGGGRGGMSGGPGGMGGGMNCPPEMMMQKMQPTVHADDWMRAWQIAKESCPGADNLNIQLTDRSGPSFEGRVFENVDLKSAGEVIIIKIKKSDKQNDLVMIVRASDMRNIEISQRASERK
jgi:hypothetical protein